MNTPVSFPLEKEFVPYTESLELKELGFDEPCFGYYYNRELSFGARTSYGEVVEAPTFSQVFRFFREKYKLVHRIDRDGGWWLCTILNLYDEQEQGTIEIYLEHSYPDTYEEAEVTCLNKLIELVKNK